MNIMSKNEKITDEQLLEELEKGKSRKKIAHEYGYGYPSAALSQRIKDLGLKKRMKAKRSEYSNAADRVFLNFSVHNLPEELQDSDELWFTIEEESDDGVLLCFSSEKWMRQSDNSTTTGDSE